MSTTTREIPTDAWVREHDGKLVEVRWGWGGTEQTRVGRMRRDEHQGGDFFYLDCADMTWIVRRHEVVKFGLFVA